MRESDELAGLVRSLAAALATTGNTPTLSRLLNMALLEAAECLVRSGFAPERLHALGVAEDVAYFIDAKYHPTVSGISGSGRHLRLVGS
ncbi:MAG: hypothetical protein JOZ16_12305 [Methylobacteriaceae bacterium]|nr:hypothetical protein [Methylobacteriaceae bacterium]